MEGDQEMPKSTTTAHGFVPLVTVVGFHHARYAIVIHIPSSLATQKGTKHEGDMCVISILTADR